MRAATALIIALLLFCGLPSCSTFKKATTKQETHQETAATFDRHTEATETAEATSTRDILETLLQRYNITLDFDRWEYNAADSMPTTGGTGITGKDRAAPASDRPTAANIGQAGNYHPTSHTKGTLTIAAEGRQTRTTKETSATQTAKTDSTRTAATRTTRNETKTEAKEQTKSTGTPAILEILICIALALVVGRVLSNWK